MGLQSTWFWFFEVSTWLLCSSGCTCVCSQSARCDGWPIQQRKWMEMIWPDSTSLLGSSLRIWGLYELWPTWVAKLGMMHQAFGHSQLFGTPCHLGLLQWFSKDHRAGGVAFEAFRGTIWSMAAFPNDFRDSLYYIILLYYIVYSDPIFSNCHRETQRQAIYALW